MKKLTLTIALCLLALAAPATASAAPIFNLDLHHNPTNFPPGGNQADAFPVISTDTQGSATENERQRLNIQATSGTFTLSFDPDGAGPLPADPPVQTFRSGRATPPSEPRSKSLPSIGAGDVAVSTTGETYTVTFQGALANTDVAQLIVADGAVPLKIDPEYWVDIANVGSDPTSGQITLTLALPSGITRRSIDTESGEYEPQLPWSCPGSAGDRVIVCTTTGTILRHRFNRNIKVAVDVARTVPEGAVRTLSARVSGGGAAEATATEPTPISSTPAPFGVLADTFVPDFFAADGLSAEREAGAHPDLLTVPFDFNSVDVPTHFLGAYMKRESDSIRNIEVDAPPGFLGDPTAVGECAQAPFVIGACPPSSQVGRLEVTTHPPLSTTNADYHTFNRPVYNLTQPRGALTDLAMVIAANPVHIRASLDPANRYAITTHVPDINETLPPLDQKLILWGVPADPSHDSERCPIPNGMDNIDTSQQCSTDFEPMPFLTLPFECGVEKAWRLHHYDSWQDTGVFGPDLTYTMPGGFSDCDRVPFAPTISLAPTTDAADSPSGLDLRIELPQDEDCEQIAPAPPAGETQYDCGIATSPLKDATVTLPEGLTVNPASANGLDACTPAQISLGTDDAIRCPDAARIASVVVDTVLPDPVQGVVYLATPYENPFNTLLAGYIVLSDPDLGLLVKIPGRIDVDQNTGQLTAFTDNPQLPFGVRLHFLGGPRASLTTPPTCGTYTSNSVLHPLVGQPGGANHRQLHDQPGRRRRALRRLRGRDAHQPLLRRRPGQPGPRQLQPLRASTAPRRRLPALQRPELDLPPGLTGKLAGTSFAPTGRCRRPDRRAAKPSRPPPPARLTSASASSTPPPERAPPPTTRRAPPTSPAPTKAPRSRSR